MPRNRFKLTLETWNDAGTRTTCTSHEEDDVSDIDLVDVEQKMIGVFVERAEVGKRKLNPS